jgi:hypothetical protein
LVAVVPPLFRKRVVRIAAAIVMGLFVLISGYSIGMFYLPASVLMLLALAWETRRCERGVVADGVLDAAGSNKVAQL